MTAREEVLARIRTALGGADRPVTGAATAGEPTVAEALAGTEPGEAAVMRQYLTHSELSAGALLSLLAERLRDYGASVRIAAPASVAEAVRAALAERGAGRIVVPPGLEIPGLQIRESGLAAAGDPGSDLSGVAVVVDDGLSAADLDQCDGVVTTAAVAIAETGTIVLDGSPGQGRRALTLVPDYHLCVLREDQVVGLVPEALARLRPERPLSWISGPSATSDIELDRVQGVHGPRTLEVILVSAE
jgi:L-lactate utilization protein LutC